MSKEEKTNNLKLGDDDLCILQQRVTDRLYHEDNLFAQRSSNFVIAHSFLIVAFTFPTSGNNVHFLAYIVGGLGLLLSLFYITFAFRSYNSIRFWRVYLHGIEAKTGIEVDNLRYEFNKEGKVNTPVGGIGHEDSKAKPMNKLFPWCIQNSTNFWVGIGMPILVALFWAGALVWIPNYQCTVKWVLGVLIVIIVALVIARRLIPADPTFKESNEE